MIMTQMTKLLTYVYRRQAVVLGGDTAYLFVPYHQDYQRLTSFWSKYPTLEEKDPRAMNLRRNSSQSLNYASETAMVDSANNRHTRFIATAIFRKIMNLRELY